MGMSTRLYIIKIRAVIWRQIIRNSKKKNRMKNRGISRVI